MALLTRRSVMAAGAAAFATTGAGWAAQAPTVHALPGPDFPPAAPGALAFLGATKSARVVGLGEATHGSHEIFQLKASFIRALAKAGRLGAIGFEIGPAAMLHIDEHIRGGQPADMTGLLRKLGNFTMATEEHLALFEWLTSYNAAHHAADRVRVFGYDVQTPGEDAAEIIGFCRSADVDVQFPEPFVAFAAQPKPIQAIPPAAAGVIVDSIGPARSAFESALSRLRTAAGKERADARFELFQSISNAFALFREPSFEAAYSKRDEFGAQAILKVAQSQRRQTAVWAHVGHINRQSYEFEGAKLLGTHLQTTLGRGYYALATAFYEGATNARRAGVKGVIANELGAARPASLDIELAALGNCYFVEIANLARLRGWDGRIAQQGVLRAIGGGYEPENDSRTYRPTRLADQYDGLAFIRTVTPSKLL